MGVESLNEKVVRPCGADFSSAVTKDFFVNSFIDLNFKLSKETQVNTISPSNIKIKLIVVSTDVKSYPPYK